MVAIRQIDFESAQGFYELDELADDHELLALVNACLEAQRTTGSEVLRASFKPNPNALHEVSEQALEDILRAGKTVSDIRTDQDISNCLVFNVHDLRNGVKSEEVISLKRQVDAAISRRLQRLFQDTAHISVVSSGHFWYPPGGYMSWHTNVRYPGWRMYINYCEEPGKSFFRYRDPDDGRIVTSLDRQWNFRLFRITQEKPLWHAVYSETNRFSLGCRISRAKPQRFIDRLRSRLFMQGGS